MYYNYFNRYFFCYKVHIPTFLRLKLCNVIIPSPIIDGDVNYIKRKPKFMRNMRAKKKVKTSEKDFSRLLQ